MPEDLALHRSREDGLTLTEVATDAELFDRLARELHEGKIVGWMDGRTEFGPRALGSRSILSAPHTPQQA